jgi:Protein of unknown function (DUF3352)
MRSRLALASAIGTVAVFAAAGCGGTGGVSGAGAAPGGGASVTPADAAVFVALDTDLGSSQWQAVNALLAKVPGSDALLARLRQSFEQHSKLSWQNDVRPALGPELDVAVLPAASGGKPETVLLTQPPDRAKLDALLAKLRQSGAAQPLTTDLGDWTAVSESQAALDAVDGASNHLADSSVYQEATGTLASDALLTAYANGAEAKQLVSALGGTLPSGNRELVWASGDVVASADGLEVDGHVRADGGTPRQSYASHLVDRIPSGALAVADFQVPSDAGSPSSSSSLLGGALQPLRSALGGETAIYVSPGTPFPAVTLVTRASDPQAVLDALQGALSKLGSVAGGGKTGSLNLGSILGALQLSHGVVGQDLVVSTSQQAVDAFKGSGQKLADDGVFQEATSAAGMPDRTTGFVYVNLKDALPVVQGLASLAGASLPGGDLSALRTLTAYGSGADGDSSSFSAFLEVR